MVHDDFSPLRSGSARSRLRQTRIIAGLAVLLLAAAIASDPLANRFWERNPLLTNLVASLVVVILTVAVINEVLERRQRRRWSVLAQYVLFELVRTARLTWTTLLELLGLMYTVRRPRRRSAPVRRRCATRHASSPRRASCSQIPTAASSCTGLSSA